MEDGVHRTSGSEVRLVRGGKTERSVIMDVSAPPTVTVLRTLQIDSEDGDPMGVFDAQVRDLQDAWDGTTRCGFCEKTNAEVRTLIAGPTFYICNECVALCTDILAE